MVAFTTGVLIASTLYSAYNQYQAGEARGDAANDQMQLGLLAARETEHRTALNSAMTLEQGRQMQGEQKAIFAGMGVDVNSGSALEVSHSTAYAAYKESNRIKREGAFDASMQRRGAYAYGDQASRERTAGTANAAGTLLSGYADYKVKKDGFS